MSSDVSLDIYITANSPGEIAGWVAPFVRELRSRVWSCRITLVVLPCQYASGAELPMAREAGVDSAVRLSRLGALMSDPARSEKTARKKMVFHMGGDFAFSVYLSKRLRAPLWAYASRPRWNFFVDYFFVPDESAERRFALNDIPADKYEKVGNLALDSVVLKESEEETRAFLGLQPGEPVISFLTGSRPIEYMHGVPYCARIASIVSARFPDHKIIFPLAGTVDEEDLARSISSYGIQWRGESRVRALDIGGGRWASVVRNRTLEVLNCSKLAVAVPGTNNLQAAALYVPFIMILPMDKAEEFPLDGIPGLLPLWIPGLKRFKKKYILELNRRTEFVSLPNKMAKKMIAPEIRGIFPLEDVAEKAIELLQSPDKLQEMSREFWNLTHERGAASRIAERVSEWSKSSDNVR